MFYILWDAAHFEKVANILVLNKSSKGKVKAQDG